MEIEMEFFRPFPSVFIATGRLPPFHHGSPLCPPLKQAPTAMKTNAAMKKKAATIPKAKNATTSSTRSNSIASRPQGLPKPCSCANVALHSDVPAMEIEAQAHQHAIYMDFQFLLDSETMMVSTSSMRRQGLSMQTIFEFQFLLFSVSVAS
jgi:hypothetical protein